LPQKKEVKYKMANQKYNILYGRLSQEDELKGDSNSIQNQDGICQGGFLQNKTVSK
jgi:hypothetical protein